MQTLGNPNLYPFFEVKRDKILQLIKNEVIELDERKLLIPTDFRKAIMENFHCSEFAGDLGFEKTL